MLHVSFYLLTPEALSQSVVYASISDKVDRLRFATGESFVAKYCNVRKRKGRKELVKKNTPFYFEYKSKLEEIQNSLIRIEMDLSKKQKCTLEQIRDSYYKQTGKLKDETAVTFNEAFDRFLTAHQSGWNEGTQKIFNSTFTHLKAYETTHGALHLEKINEDVWDTLRDNYFVAGKKFSNNSANKYLKNVKQFLRFAIRKNFIKHPIDLNSFKYLDEMPETFKIALKLHEVETLISLNLSDATRLDKVRDLFVLEALTGQRFSDLPKLLDVKHISSTSIEIIQEKTNEKVTIPLHPRLKKHLSHIFEKYPDGLPVITNQKFNEYLKEVCALAGFDKLHTWTTLTGKKKVTHSDFRYNLITSHTGRRTFCTLALKEKIHAEEIMKVTGHRSYDQFREYVKVDDEDLEMAFQGFINGKN